MQIPDWLAEQLHLATDNVHVQNIGELSISLSLFTSDGKGSWDEEQLAVLKTNDHRWITLNEHTLVFLGQTHPAGAGVLVVRPIEPRKGKSISWRVDNMHSALPLKAAVYEPRDGFSRIGANSQQLWTGWLMPQTYGWGILCTFSLEPIMAHWEYWFDPILPSP
jgi:hypothetical protein